MMVFSAKPVHSFDEDLFDRGPVVQTIVERLLDLSRDGTLMALFAPWGSGRSSMLNLCGISAETYRKGALGKKRALWLKVFDAWHMESIGNLPVSLLWHIHRCIPENIAHDEKVMFRLGRLSMALTAVGYNMGGKLSGPGTTVMNSAKSLEIVSKVLPPEKKSQVSSVFSACEQITEITSELSAIGQSICKSYGCDSVVVPIDDIDRCNPDLAISMLFTLRNLMQSKYFSFLITLDKSIMARFLNSVYAHPYSEKDAVDLVVRSFDETVELPVPFLDNSLSGLIERCADKTATQLFIRSARARNMTSLSSNAKTFMRGMAWFTEIVTKEGKKGELPVESLLAWFGWCMLETSHTDQVAALCEARNYGGEKDGIEGALEYGFQYLASKRTGISGPEMAAVPARLSGVINDITSPLMRFLDMMKDLMNAKDLAMSFEKISGAF